jgi:hypothetical protein
MRALILLAVFLFAGCNSQPAKVKDPIALPKGQIALPKDPTAHIIVYDSRSYWDVHIYEMGFWPPPNGQPARGRGLLPPLLKIQADGTMIADDRYKSAATFQLKIAAEEVQELLQFIIHDNDLLRFDQAKVEADIKKIDTGSVADSPTTTVRIKTADREHEAKYYAVDFYLERHPEVKELKQLDAVAKRLWQAYGRVLADGIKVVAAKEGETKEKVTKSTSTLP